MTVRRRNLLSILSILALAASLVLSGCTSSLEQLVEQRHQERIDAANANLPVSRGAADGMGSYMVEGSGRLSVQDLEQAKKP